MNKILSIQSHVVHGYVGNKAAVYPLQYMGYDVCPINTVQFSNHTGYGKWQGEIFTAKHILELAQGLEELGLFEECSAILSGYMGSEEICYAIKQIVQRVKLANPKAIYLCDPVIGDGKNCYVKPEVANFFANENLLADIITPNQFEAEKLSGISIIDKSSLKKAANALHKKGVGIIVITGLELIDIDADSSSLYTFASNGSEQYLVCNKKHEFDKPVNGTGDLFSSIYIGAFLSSKSFSKALQTAVFYLDKVLSNTKKQSSRELQVLSVRYDKIKEKDLPPLVGVNP